MGQILYLADFVVRLAANASVVVGNVIAIVQSLIPR